ncbi:predicted protein [Arabidopsis lyrata subsp. lyrata]|uniref:Predicted protein n=1 Tax=Arabidopsis lyrata subsp. lyrata TaxID=81972 RepID=D7M1S2_ARALL|nr:predicted protein [Arabidopsis lyrata subsp. lyrata]
MPQIQLEHNISFLQQSYLAGVVDDCRSSIRGGDCDSRKIRSDTRVPSPVEQPREQ